MPPLAGTRSEWGRGGDRTRRNTFEEPAKILLKAAVAAGLGVNFTTSLAPYSISILELKSK
jgi:hypothetical protein